MISIADFLSRYFIYPLMQNDAGYNIFNTPVYGIILAIAVFAIYRILKKLEIPVDKNFFIATLPFVLLGGLLRALRDAEILKNVVFIAPVMYFTIFAVAFAALMASFYSAKFLKVQYWKLMSCAGFAILAFFALFYRLKYPIPLAQILALAAVSVLIIYACGKFRPKIFSQINKWILSAGMFDACSTFVGVALYSYGEKHVLPNFLFGVAGGAWIMLPLKFFVVLLALYVIDRYEKDIFFRNFIKFAILTVTLGPGLRNTLRLAAGV